ncbi:unnamed protein product [Sphagnum jensenii]|uniref:Uncharacterized protein n=1 Tax=Sphagnum jensenii TaxID=128206 RepID=A0ABP1ATR0_9BRYO
MKGGSGGIWVLILHDAVLLLMIMSQCIVLVTGDVHVLNDSGLFLRVSVKKSSGIPKQSIIMTPGPPAYDHNFTVAAGKVGTFTFVQVTSAKVKIADGKTVILLQQQPSGTSGPGLYGYLDNTLGAPIFGLI